MREQRISSYRKIILLALWLIVPCAYGGVVLTTLVSFDGTNGRMPMGLTLGKDGNFYGATELGGANDIGVVFKMTPDGKSTNLATFNGSNGKWPSSELVQDKDGNFYGTTSQGGRGDGAVFKLTPDSKIILLVSFSDYNDMGGEDTNGLLPYEIVNGNDDNFYGVTAKSGFNKPGTIFKITPDGIFKTLGSFKPQAEPAWLAQATDNNFYVVTRSTKFRMTPLKVLSNLQISSLGKLTRNKDGSLFGTAPEGGPRGGGTIYKMNISGVPIVLVAFDINNGTNGCRPNAPLTLGKDGNFYGTTFAGGTSGFNSGQGTVFKMTPNGELTTLAVFNGNNGSHPTAQLVQAKDGSFYGVTSDGGLYKQGTIFRLTVTP